MNTTFFGVYIPELEFGSAEQFVEDITECVREVIFRSPHPGSLMIGRME